MNSQLEKYLFCKYDYNMRQNLDLCLFKKCKNKKKKLSPKSSLEILSLLFSHNGNASSQRS